MKGVARPLRPELSPESAFPCDLMKFYREVQLIFVAEWLNIFWVTVTALMVLSLAPAVSCFQSAIKL